LGVGGSIVCKRSIVEGCAKRNARVKEVLLRAQKLSGQDEFPKHFPEGAVMERIEGSI